MRLTLRTLLAHRDQVLEPKDAEVLEQRLRESQTAQTISDRINNLVSNPSVSPIEIDAQGFGIDANDVACFLDDTMATDRVADMERICLQNNALLAEVASCHQILVKTIRTPVQISARFRNRIQGFWNQRNSETERLRRYFDERRLREDAPHRSVKRPFGIPMSSSPTGAETNGAPADRLTGQIPLPLQNENTADRTGIRMRNQVPQYLRETRRPGIGSSLRLVILVILFAVCVIQSLGSRQRLAELFDRETSDWSSRGKASPLEPTAR